jgi:hypothetical protein
VLGVLRGDLLDSLLAVPFPLFLLRGPASSGIVNAGDKTSLGVAGISNPTHSLIPSDAILANKKRGCCGQ